ncbi:uncharacterized protein LOC143047692 [Mytilus galloprovincialis]|uniref:uncharacterized protein LOC143047692 n=1 Tax=Mytilus galloprovincialis TaxID=29158 RepID=UPI003F7C7F50
MFVHHHDEIKVLELWNLRNLFCGKWGEHEAYRNDYIDNVDLDCIEKITVRIVDKDGEQLALEYLDITTKKLEDYLRRKPDRATADEWDGTRDSIQTDQYLVNEGNYEFRWLNQNGDRIFAAFYYDSSADKFPIFYYSEEKEGAEHTEPDKDNDSGMIESHDIRVSFTVQNIDKCNEANVHHSIFLDECPEFKSPTVTSSSTSYTEDIGTNITLNCQHSANNDPVTKIEWLFQNNLISTNWTKYGGSTVDSPSLILYNIMPDDIGRYQCQAFTDYASKPGSGPLISVTLKEAAPVFKESISEYEFEVGGDIQLPCSYEAFPLATDVKWIKDSNTITNCVLTDSSVVQAASMDSTRCQSVISVLNPYLVISNAQNSDSGIYKCCVTNTISEQCGNDIIVGYPSLITTTTQNPGTTSTSTTSDTTQNPRTTSLLTKTTSTQNAGTTSAVTTSTTTQNPGTTSVSTMLTTPTSTTKPKAISCQCPCSSLGKGTRQDFSNYTIDELFELLAPQLAKMEKELSVDKSNLSATVNKRISAKDERQSSQSIGILGIVFIVSVILGVVIIDLMSLIHFLKPKLKRGNTDTSGTEERQE